MSSACLPHRLVRSLSAVIALAVLSVPAAAQQSQPSLAELARQEAARRKAVKDTKKVKQAAEELGQIAGQKAVITKAKKSIAGFRVREEMPLGCKVTLRGDRMYEFLDRLINVALPRVRDFRGVKAPASMVAATTPWA